MFYYLLFLALFCSASAESGLPCTTPNGEKGTCKPLSSCLHFQRKILDLDTDAITFTLDSVCPNETTKMVCCGSIVSYAPQELYELKPIEYKLLPKPSLCGLQINEKAVRESDVVIPWMSVLRYINPDKSDAGFKCRGAIINQRHIVTAAQCLYKEGFLLNGVRVGMWKLSTTTECAGSACPNIKDFDIDSATPHPDYNKNYGLHNIALIRVTEAIIYDEYIRPICLPPNNNDLPQTTDELYTGGWYSSTRRDLQMKQPLTVQHDEECSAATYNLTELVLCPSGRKYKYACEGSVTGNPIVRKYPSENTDDDEQWYLEGIMYGNPSCKQKRFSGPYLRVSKYVLWILKLLE